ncbi:RNA-binding motif protein, Y chromosome, family 1 member F/J [Penicillium digitatum]|nr:RNA-binding motif protein, Y chromosome, family 1 member F/J [Penicillium digitatum]
MPKDSPFQVSVHSWEKPRPSVQIESNMEPEDVLLFEVRIFIDGIFAAGSIYGQRTVWPQIMDLSSNLDRDGNQDALRFPQFHSEILQQKHWDAGDSQGRIKIVIAEGFSRPNRSPPFERYKHVIAFSFQHAPLDVLEFSDIAWPNPNMWLVMPPNASRYGPAARYGTSKIVGDGAHGHSPSKPSRPEHRITITANTSSQISSNAATYSGSNSSTHNAWTPNRGFPIPSTQWNGYAQEPRWDPQDAYIVEPAMDAFIVDDRAWRQRGARSSREDIPMPDYASTGSTSSRAISSSMTGMSYEHSKQPSITSYLDDEQYNELIQALTPTKAPPVGTRAPSNTPSTAATAISASKPSAAAEARSAGYKTRSRRASALRELSQPSTRHVSGSSEPKNLTPSRIGASLSDKVRSKKEIHQETSQENPKAQSEGKVTAKEKCNSKDEENAQDENESVL